MAEGWGRAVETLKVVQNNVIFVGVSIAGFAVILPQGVAP
jgi:hypothetical protein